MVRKNYGEYRSFTTGDIAKILGLGRTSTKTLIDSGRLKAHRTVGSDNLPGDRRVMRQTLIDYAEEHGIPIEIGGHDWQILVISMRELFFPAFRVVFEDHMITADSVFRAGIQFNHHTPEFAVIDWRLEDAFALSVVLQSEDVKVASVSPAIGMAGANYSCCVKEYSVQSAVLDLPEVAKRILKEIVRKPA